MAPEALVIEPHPDALYYLKVQALLMLGIGLAWSFLFGIVVLFSKKILAGGNVFWLVAGAAGIIVCAHVGIRSLLLDTPTIAVEGDTFRVGDTRVPIDNTTELIYGGALDDLKPPDDSETGYFRLPGARGFPPHFDGGPTIQVRTGSQEVTFQPVLYGPASYFGDAGGRQPAELVAALLANTGGGNARSWLESSFTAVDGDTQSSKSFGTFLTYYLIFAIPVLSFFGGIVVIGIKKKLG